MAAPAFLPKQRIIYFQGAKIMQTNGKCIKNLMSHQIFNKKSYGFLLYFTSQGLHSLLLPASIPYYR